MRRPSGFRCKLCDGLVVKLKVKDGESQFANLSQIRPGPILEVDCGDAPAKLGIRSDQIIPAVYHCRGANLYALSNRLF